MTTVRLPNPEIARVRASIKRKLRLQGVSVDAQAPTRDLLAAAREGLPSGQKVPSSTDGLIQRVPMKKKNDDLEYVARRKHAMTLAGIRQTDLIERWRKRFGSASRSLVNQIVLGQLRSHKKELDFARAVGKPHDYLFAPSRARKKAAAR